MLARFLARWLRPRAPVELRLYTKPGCPLCDEVKAELARVRVRPPFRLLEIDIERVPELLLRHGRSIPVLEIAGRTAFKGRFSTAEFERKYARRVAELGAGVVARADGGPGHA